MGGKARIARQLAGVMLRGDLPDVYIEPFVGAGWMFERMAPHFKASVASDIHPDLILMWRAVAGGWIPPTELSREQYNELRHAEPSALRAFAGFGCSFGGKWFGGYASNKPRPGRLSFPAAATAGIKKKIDAFANAVIIQQCSYEYWDSLVRESAPLVYCDPPYAGTTEYQGAPAWDSAEFWARVESWARYGARVFVSEYSAPPGWSAVWEREVLVSLKKDTNTATGTERLFTWSGS